MDGDSICGRAREEQPLENNMLGWQDRIGSNSLGWAKQQGRSPGCSMIKYSSSSCRRRLINHSDSDAMLEQRAVVLDADDDGDGRPA
jgi:hypothetical protein